MSILNVVRVEFETVVAVIARDFINAIGIPDLEKCQFNLHPDSEHHICFWVWSPTREIIEGIIESISSQTNLAGRDILLRAGCERVVFCYGKNHLSDVVAVLDLK